MGILVGIRGSVVVWRDQGLRVSYLQVGSGGWEEDPEGPGREGGEGGPHSYSEYRRMDKP